MKLIIFLLTLNILHAQVKVGNNPTTINPSSILEMESTSKGFLMPRLTVNEINSIENPEEGLTVFNLTTKCFSYYQNGKWMDICGFMDYQSPVKGSEFTRINNGYFNQFFSDNLTCTEQLISAGHTPNTCNGSVVTANTTYTVALINGQCWMRENLKEPPSLPCSSAINTGCNIWNASTITDQGKWGFYNNTTTNGTAGWRTSEASLNEGLLYQWSAAMNGSNTERTRGVCPQGWHIPSDCEWKYLEHSLGMSIADQNDIGLNRTSGFVAIKLSATTLATSNNSTGLTLRANVGMRRSNGTFANRNLGFIWTSSQVNVDAIITRELASTGNTLIRRNNVNPATAASVRCLKD